METKGLMSFGDAIEAVKSGKLIARVGWNGKGMFVFQRPECSLSTEMIINRVKSLPDAFKRWVEQNCSESETNMIKFNAYLCMKAADGSIVNGWLASQTDILSEDWMIVG